MFKKLPVVVLYMLIASVLGLAYVREPVIFVCNKPELTVATNCLYDLGKAVDCLKSGFRP